MRRPRSPPPALRCWPGPTALAFFTGGYFDGPRDWAGLVAWLLVAVARSPAPAAASAAAGPSLALGGLAAARGVDAAVDHWAPIAGNAYHAGQIVVLYLGALLAAVLLLRRPAGRRALVEPALAAGTLIVDRLRALRAAAARACCTSRARSAPRAGSSSR